MYNYSDMDKFNIQSNIRLNNYHLMEMIFLLQPSTNLMNYLDEGAVHKLSNLWD